MATLDLDSLTDLYEQDETAWLEIMAELAASKQIAAMDLTNLSEYLSDMAKRDRREVYSRLVVLMAHLLKWEHQPEKQTGSWQATIGEQRLELRMLLESGTLRNHADIVLSNAYADARKRAAQETEMTVSTFPPTCAWDLDDLLRD
jgi:Domain of unknown function DUF29